MEKLEVIKSINEPTSVVSPMVIVQKSKKIRICLDPSELNHNILRRRRPLKTVEDIAARVSKSKYFTLLDCARGFWQIRVTKPTQKYLAVATSWGRYVFTRLPLGLASAPKIFQFVKCSILTKISNVKCSMDDIFIHAETLEEMRKFTNQVIHILKKAGLKVNKEKCYFE